MRNGEMICSECLQLQKQEMEYPYLCKGCDIKLDGTIRKLQYDYLVENKFDVFGLIDNGLAEVKV